MNLQRINIEILRPAAYNPRKDLQPTDLEYQKIKRSIETCEYIAPIIVNRYIKSAGDAGVFYVAIARNCFGKKPLVLDFRCL